VTNETGRRLVVCLDGTWNSTFAEHKRQTKEGEHTVLKPTNTLKLCRAVKPLAGDDRKQICYYDIGVGALAKYDGTANVLLYHSDRLLGGAWAAGFEGNVEDALHFLTLNFRPGDEVFIFGFSRGSAEARAVTHFLDWNGGLPQKQDAYYLPILFREYIKPQGQGDSTGVVATFTDRPPEPFNPVRVKFLGVWETVLALGSRLKATDKSTTAGARSFYTNARLAACVDHARQALAVDEHRYDFRPEIWNSCLPTQTMKQRWFVGVHSNIGGGYGKDGLANVALGWMVEGAKAAGLQLDDAYLHHYLNPDARIAWGSLYNSKTWGYVLLDGIRLGNGRRKLVDVPASANAEIDASVIERMTYDVEKLKDRVDEGAITTLYRPQNVIEFLVAQPNVAAYLSKIGAPALPADVSARIAKLKAQAAAVPAPAP